MRVRIHRGATEIGGNCVELQSEGATILLDLGRPLWAGPGEHVPLPAAIGLGEPGPAPLAVLLTHGHQDHWGLVPDLPAGIPIWIGQGAADVLRAAEFWGTGIDLHETGHFQHRAPITIGPFTITPYLADHSAFDAYSLLVEAGGIRLFYTGDLRGHGRKHAAFDWLLDDPPTDVDVLLLEGTNLRAPHPDQRQPRRRRWPPRPTSRTTCSPPSRHHGPGGGARLGAERRPAGHRLPGRAQSRTGGSRVDLYTAEVAAATGRDSIPHLDPDWPKCRRTCRSGSGSGSSRPASSTAPRPSSRTASSTRSSPPPPARWVLFGAYQGHIPHLLKAGLLDRRGRGLVTVGRLPHRHPRPAVRLLAGEGRYPADPPPHLRARQP